MDNLLTLFDLIGVLARRRYQAAERSFSALGLNHTEARLLTLLHEQGGAATQEALSNMIFVDRSNAGRAMKGLEEKGYIERRKDEGDKRTNLVHITAKGGKALAEVSQVKIALAQSFFGDLTNEEAGAIVKILGRVIKNEEHRTAPPTMSSEDWNRRYATEEFIWTVNANRFLAAEAANLSPGRALDLASGEGRNAVWLAERGWAVCAVDFSDVAIEKAGQLAATRKVANNIDFQVADVRDYEPEVHHFDLVLLTYLQIPLAELAPVLVRAARAVAPGGTFLLVAHDLENLKHGYGGPQNPDVLYSAEQVVAVLDGELEIEKAARIERPVETDSGIKVALDCLVRGRRR